MYDDRQGQGDHFWMVIRLVWPRMCLLHYTLSTDAKTLTSRCLEKCVTHDPPLQGYFMGAWMYLGIVFTLPLGLGVYALALDLPVNTDEALQGLVMPASAYVLLGKGGDNPVIAKTTCIFLACVRA